MLVSLRASDEPPLCTSGTALGRQPPRSRHRHTCGCTAGTARTAPPPCTPRRAHGRRAGSPRPPPRPWSAASALAVATLSSCSSFTFLSAPWCSTSCCNAEPPRSPPLPPSPPPLLASLPSSLATQPLPVRCLLHEVGISVSLWSLGCLPPPGSEEEEDDVDSEDAEEEGSCCQSCCCVL
jgi:hypothetical protein